MVAACGRLPWCRARARVNQNAAAGHDSHLLAGSRGALGGAWVGRGQLRGTRTESVFLPFALRAYRDARARARDSRPATPGTRAGVPLPLSSLHAGVCQENTAQPNPCVYGSASTCRCCLSGKYRSTRDMHLYMSDVRVVCQEKAALPLWLTGSSKVNSFPDGQSTDTPLFSFAQSLGSRSLDPQNQGMV